MLGEIIIDIGIILTPIILYSCFNGCCGDSRRISPRVSPVPPPPPSCRGLYDDRLEKEDKES